MRRRQFLSLSSFVFAFPPIALPANQEASVKETIIQTRTINMSILDSGQGPLVLFCHGFPETKYAWRHQINAVAQAGYRAVAPDMRGYGGTDAPEDLDQYTVFHAVGDLVALLDALGEHQAVVVGHDWGATIAWQAALLRPDRFRALVALSVPMMGQPPMPPSKILPQTEDALFYTLYFQKPTLADEEFNRDVSLTLRKLMFAASGEAGPRKPGDGTPNPFGMVAKSTGLLASLPTPASLPDWLPSRDFDQLVRAFEQADFTGGLNYYRNLDRNWELQQAYVGQVVQVPALFIIGERDTGLTIPGMEQIIAAMPNLVPDLRGSYVLQDAGHWLQQERAKEVSDLAINFLGEL